MTNAHEIRREQDVLKLRDLALASNGKIKIATVSGKPPQTLELDLSYATAGGSNYPDSIQNTTRVVISLLTRYPFVEPSVRITTPILHPNVYTSGQVCLGRKWIASEGLDLLVKRLVQIVTFDPSVLNEESPANRAALSWYRSQKKIYPNAFPTQKVSFSLPNVSTGISWVNKK